MATIFYINLMLICEKILQAEKVLFILFRKTIVSLFGQLEEQQGLGAALYKLNVLKMQVFWSSAMA